MGYFRGIIKFDLLSLPITESHMKNIKPFNGIDFPLWKEKVQDILKSLELDYVLHKDKPLPSSPDIEKYDEKMHEYQFKLEKWEKDNKFAKTIIKRSISEGIKGEFDDNEDTTASELFFLIELEHKRVSTRFLFARLTTLRYDGYSGIIMCIFCIQQDLDILVDTDRIPTEEEKNLLPPQSKASASSCESSLYHYHLSL
ncbi:hypothetical protein EJB05_33495, partial [Eragrostis curvula]